MSAPVHERSPDPDPGIADRELHAMVGGVLIEHLSDGESVRLRVLDSVRRELPEGFRHRDQMLRRHSPVQLREQHQGAR